MNVLPSATSSEAEHHSDFVLFDDIYSGFRGAPRAGTFIPAILPSTGACFPGLMEEGSNISDELQEQVSASIGKQYYSLETSPQDMVGPLSIASSPPGYPSRLAYGSYQVPRALGASYMQHAAAITSAPDVLVHPPTTVSWEAPYRSTQPASPATSVGGFDGSGSGFSGSEAGSSRNSPYNPPVGFEDHFQEFAIQHPYVGMFAFPALPPLLRTLTVRAARY